MKTLFMIFFLFVVSLYAGDLTTKSGNIYKNYDIHKVASYGLEIFHDEGITTVPFADLPDDIRTQYAELEKKIIEQEKKRLEKQKKDFALQKISRPIMLTPLEGGGNAICRWSRHDISYSSIEDALRDASPYMIQKYKEAKKEENRLKNRTAEEVRTDYLSAADVAVASGGSIRDAQFYLHRPLQGWMSEMNSSLDAKYAYPKSSRIIVQDLPENTLSNVAFSTIVYCIGTMKRNGITFQLYTVDKNKALEFTQQQNK